MSRLGLGPACAAVAISATLDACSRTPEPIPPGTDTPYYGFITRGEKFGVSIGDLEGAARSSIRNARYDGAEPCAEYLAETINCREGELFQAYRAQWPLRDGVFWLRISSGRVSAIAWTFSLADIDS
jgi:hypothetical protein